MTACARLRLRLWSSASPVSCTFRLVIAHSRTSLCGLKGLDTWVHAYSDPNTLQHVSLCGVHLLDAPLAWMDGQADLLIACDEQSVS